MRNETATAEAPASRTAGPMTLSEHHDHHGHRYVIGPEDATDPNWRNVATVYAGDAEDKANAEFIVRAVNHHDELVEACKLALTAFMPWGTDHPAQDALKAILAKVEA